MFDRNVELVRKRLADRAATGLRKYGVTTERGDLSIVEWLQHLQDELLDAAVYVERLKGEAVPAIDPRDDVVTAMEMARRIIDAPCACTKCKAVTVRSGEREKCLNCGWDRSWYVGLQERIARVLAFQRAAPSPCPLPEGEVSQGGAEMQNALKKWKPWKFDECLHCGSDAEVLTELHDGLAYDGDKVRCVECGCPGFISVDDGVETNSGESLARVSWHDTAPGECSCDWCMKNNQRVVEDAAPTPCPLPEGGGS